jgi:hypothetical protein
MLTEEQGDLTSTSPFSMMELQASPTSKEVSLSRSTPAMGSSWSIT